MIVSKPKKPHRLKIFHRSSLLIHFKSKNRLKHHSYPCEEKLKNKSRTRRIIKNLHQTYRSLCFTVTFVFRLFVYIDRITRGIYAFIEKLIQIIRVIDGWIQMIRSILSAVYLIMSRIMILSSRVYRIFHLLSLLFEPISNGTFQHIVRSFSNFLSDYYSSDGACYTLQARTRHIVGKVRERWTRKCNCINDDDNIYYDTYSEEYEWL